MLRWYVCCRRISSETPERISLEFWTGTEFRPGRCVSHFGDDRPRGTAKGAENAPWGIYCVCFALINSFHFYYNSYLIFILLQLIFNVYYNLYLIKCGLPPPRVDVPYSFRCQKKI